MMIVLNPQRVTFGSVELRHVVSVAVNRKAELLVVDYSDLGPHVAFVDAPRQRVTVTIVRSVVENELTSLEPGQSATLMFRTAPTAASPKSLQVSMTAVVATVEFDTTAKRGMEQTVTLVAVSEDGAAEPVTRTLVSGG